MGSLIKNKKVLIGIVVVIIALFAYAAIFVAGKEDEGDGLSRQAVSSSAADTGIPELEDGPAKEFVNQLLAIQNITFKISIFDDVVYKNMRLVDDTIAPQPQGRRNPFLPFETFGSSITPSETDLGISSSTSTEAQKGKTTPTKPKRTR